MTLCPEESGFIQKLNEPFEQDDWPARWAVMLVYADWLEERNRPERHGWRWLVEQQKLPGQSVSAFLGVSDGMKSALLAGGDIEYPTTWDWWRAGIEPADPYNWPIFLPRGQRKHHCGLPEDLFELLGHYLREQTQMIAGRDFYGIGRGTGRDYVEFASAMLAEFSVVQTIARNPQLLPRLKRGRNVRTHRSR